MAFPLQLDVYEFATPELKAELDGPRSTETALEEERDAVVKRQKREQVRPLTLGIVPRRQLPMVWRRQARLPCSFVSTWQQSWTEI